MRANGAGKNIWENNCCERSEPKFLGKTGTFPPILVKVKIDYLFSFKNRTDYLFSAFQGQNIYFQKVLAPPSQNQMVVPLDLVDMFDDSPWYLDDMLTIDNPEFEIHTGILSKCMWQRNFFSVFNIKMVGDDSHTSFYDNCDEFGFPIVNFPWLSDVPRLPFCSIYISQLIHFARCCTSV